MRKKKKPSPKHRQDKGEVRFQEIAGILLFAFSIFAGLALYIDSMGQLGAGLRNVLRILFGDAAIIFTATLFFLSVHFLKSRTWRLTTRKTIGLILILLAATTLFHMLYHHGYQLPPDFKEELAYGRKGEGAGVVGALLLVLSYTAFGISGSYIFVGAVVLIGIIIFFGVSLLDLIRFLGELVLGGAARLVQGRKERRARRETARIRRLQKQEMAAKPRPKPKVEVSPQPKKAPAVKERPVARKTRSKKAKPVPKEEGQLTLNFAMTNTSGDYRLPPLRLLRKGDGKSRRSAGNQQELLEKTLLSFGIEARVVNVSQGPVVTRYELQPAPGIKVARITALADDLALALAAEDVRIEAPVPGKPVVGIEVPNKSNEPVFLRDVLESPELIKESSPVALALGKDIAGRAVSADLKDWLHILVAGATGSGKSVCLNAMIASILFRTTPDQVRLLMIDPKRVELSAYDGIPHLISPVVIDPKKAAVALRWAVAEMEKRYRIFAETGVRNIDAYNALETEEEEEKEEEKPERESLPLIVIVVDELADLMMVAATEVEDAICRLAQMARAAGMYLIIATQRPSVDVITGLIKANVPSRISFAVSSQVDSRTILDMGGAERLIGKGDMLYYPAGASKPVRAQGALITDKEVENLVNFWKKQGEPDYEENVQSVPVELDLAKQEEDELLEDAIRLVVENGQASISMLQRRFRIGYSRAARLIDTMEVRGIVGSYQGSKPRDVLVDSTFLKDR